jgi:hypothetical protein
MAETAEHTMISSFTMEADHPRNCDLLIQNIPGLRLRSAIEGTRPVIDQGSGDALVPADQSRSLASLPRVPGMLIKVLPEECLVIVEDQLDKDERLKSRLLSFLKQNTGFQSESIKGVDTQKLSLDEHSMKTLCRELHGIMEAGEGTLIRGAMPKIKDIDNMPGRYLLNPGSTIQNSQPRYEDEYEEWKDHLSRLGG